MIEDSLDEYSTTAGMITILADSLDEYILTSAASTLIEDSLDEYPDTALMQDSLFALRDDIRDTVKVIPISKTATLVDPTNFAYDTVPLYHFDSTAYPSGATLTQLAFNSLDAASDTVWLVQWSDAVGTASAWVDTLILSSATRVRSTSFTDGAFEPGSWLVLIKAKAGNTIRVETVEYTFTGGN